MYWIEGMEESRERLNSRCENGESFEERMEKDKFCMYGIYPTKLKDSFFF